MNEQEFLDFMYKEYIEVIAMTQQVCPITYELLDYKTCVVVDAYDGDTLKDTQALSPNAIAEDSLRIIITDFAIMRMRPVFLSLNPLLKDTIKSLNN
jgi:hypothetical protein